MLNGWLVGEWQGWIGGGRLPPYPGGLHIIWAAALSAEPTLICGPRPHYGLDPHSRPHNATQGSTSAQSVRQCARVLGGKKRPDVPVPGGPGLYRLPKIGKLQKLGNWGCGRRPTGMLQFLSSYDFIIKSWYIIEETACLQQTLLLNFELTLSRFKLNPFCWVHVCIKRQLGVYPISGLGNFQEVISTVKVLFTSPHPKIPSHPPTTTTVLHPSVDGLLGL